MAGLDALILVKVLHHIEYQFSFYLCYLFGYMVRAEFLGPVFILKLLEGVINHSHH